MADDNYVSEERPRSATPNSRFQSQGFTAEELLKEQTVGLVHLSDFRKRRAEALEISERGTPSGSGTVTPDGRESENKLVFKKKKPKTVKKGGLSFGDDEAEDEIDASSKNTPASTTGSNTPRGNDSAPVTDSEAPALKKRLKPNSAVGFQPKALTKSALLREAQLKEELRKEYLQLQEAVKQTDFAIPFSFFNGTSSDGGICRMKKGDQIWLFLERARKVGADLAGKGDRSKKDWARISVDDLMMVRGDLIIPHHYEFQHFLTNRTHGYHGVLFPYSAEATAATPQNLLPSNLSKASTPQPEEENRPSYLTTASDRKKEAAAPPTVPEAELEGFDEDPNTTKVVDRRWYERNKHIYPASLWEDFDPSRDYSKGGRNDAQGNALFFTR